MVKDNGILGGPKCEPFRRAGSQYHRGRIDDGVRQEAPNVVFQDAHPAVVASGANNRLLEVNGLSTLHDERVTLEREELKKALRWVRFSNQLGDPRRPEMFTFVAFFDCTGGHGDSSCTKGAGD